MTGRLLMRWVSTVRHAGVVVDRIIPVAWVRQGPPVASMRGLMPDVYGARVVRVGSVCDCVWRESP